MLVSVEDNKKAYRTKKNMVLLLLSLCQHDNESLKLINSLSTFFNIGIHVYAEINHCVLSRLTLFLGMCRCHAGISPHRSHLHLYLVGPAACIHQTSSRLCRQLCVHTDNLAALRAGLVAEYYAHKKSNIPLVTPSQMVIIYLIAIFTSKTICAV